MSAEAAGGVKCPRCGWAGGDEALFCARCGESLMATPREPWYLRTSVLILAFLTVGPFAIPLVWINPRFSTTRKAVVTAVIAALTALFAWLSVYSINQIRTYYDLIAEPWPGAGAAR